MAQLQLLAQTISDAIPTRVRKAITDGWTYALAALLGLLAPADPTVQGAVAVVSNIIINAVRRSIAAYLAA